MLSCVIETCLLMLQNRGTKNLCLIVMSLEKSGTSRSYTSKMTTCQCSYPYVCIGSCISKSQHLCRALALSMGDMGQAGHPISHQPNRNWCWWLDYHFFQNQSGERKDFTLVHQNNASVFLSICDVRKPTEQLKTQTRENDETRRGDSVPWAVWCNHCCQVMVLINAGISF